MPELLALISAAPATPPPGGAPSILPDRPADPEIEKGIIATVREIAACTNAGDSRRLFALYSDDILRGVGLDPAEFTAPPAPRPTGERMAFIGVFYARQLADGRAGAVLVLDDPRAPSPAEAFFGIFERVGDRWLFDQFADELVTEFESGVEEIPADG